MRELTDTPEPTETAVAAETVSGVLARWVRAVPPLLRICLTLAAAITGLWVSEHSLLYAPLGFPNEIGHGPAGLLVQPGVQLLLVVALSVGVILRRPSAPAWRPRLERVLHGTLLVMLVYTCVLAPAQANQAAAAIRAGKPFFSPPLAPLTVNVASAEVEWRADVPTSARVGYGGALLYVGWVAGGAAHWFWDADRHAAVGVPAMQIALVRTCPSPDPAIQCKLNAPRVTDPGRPA